MTEELDEMLKSELIEKAESLGLDTDGTKAVLKERILEALAAEPVEEPEDAPEDCCDDEECTDSACAEEVVEEVVEKVVEEKSMLDLLTDEPDETASNEEFIKWAYESILKRKADDGGLMHYLNGMRLRNWTREHIKKVLSESDEALALAELDKKSK